MAIKSSRRDALVPLGGPTCQARLLVRFWVGLAHSPRRGAHQTRRKGGGLVKKGSRGVEGSP